MEVKASQTGPDLTINVKFDAPEQAELFHDLFEKMMQDFADKANAHMFTGETEEEVISKAKESLGELDEMQQEMLESFQESISNKSRDKKPINNPFFME